MGRQTGIADARLGPPWATVLSLPVQGCPPQAKTFPFPVHGCPFPRCCWARAAITGAPGP